MGKRLATTPRSRIKNAIRRLWMQSRERAQALKDAGYACQRCGAKQSRAKDREVYVEVHHKNGINWDGIIDDIQERVLQAPEDYEVLCRECHRREHEQD